MRGNVTADSAAKLAFDLTPDKFRIPHIDLKPKINKPLHAKWQQHWNNNTHNKLFQIQPTLGKWKPAFGKSRENKSLNPALHICHTRLTHSFILKQDQNPECLTCQMPCTIKHVPIECRAFALIRKWFFKVNRLSDLFNNVKMNDVLSYGTVKLLKPDYPLRLIISLVTTPICQLTKPINDLIIQYLSRNYSFKSTKELIEILKTHKPNKGIISSLGVENFFTNVPILETINKSNIYHHSKSTPILTDFKILGVIVDNNEVGSPLYF